MDTRQLGDYRLLEPLSTHPGQTTWLAEQTSVGRTVVIVELTELEYRDEFLAQVRAKAAVNHPLISSVYEAVSDEEQCFVALEHLPSASLAAHLQDRIKLPPLRLAHALRRTAEAMLRLEGIATEPLTPAAIHIDGLGAVRLENIACDGAPEPDREISDVMRLGETLPAIVADGQPGAGRLQTVLAWMRGEGLDAPIGWAQVRTYSEQVENQLLESSPVAATTRPVRKRTALLPAVLGGLAVVAGLGLAGLLKKDRDTPPPAPSEPSVPGPIEVGAGNYFTPDGDKTDLAAYQLGACEVTIGEYHRFLDVLSALPPEDRDVFDHPGQPAEKEHHEPSDWTAMFSAAQDGRTWEGRPMSLNCPVVNVDWYDAAAYCRWAGGRLPTQEEWFAPLESPSTLLPADWGPVTDIGPRDTTPNGLRGMAGSVAEWTLEPGINPANPAGQPAHVIIGGSFIDSSSGAWTRQWTSDLLLRRDNLGFRILIPLSKKP